MAALLPLQAALKQAGVLLLAAGIAGTLAGLANHPDRPEAFLQGEITLSGALSRQPPPLWIDARTEQEYLEEHIPGALLLNPKNWESFVGKVLDAWEPGQAAIVYCCTPGGQASREVAGRLGDLRFGPVFVLHGGWDTWKQK